jgi:adenosylhomocysteine nucleosidase
MIALLGAFRQETAALRRQVIIEKLVTSRAWTVYQGKLRDKDCVIVQTGMGKVRAEGATQYLLDHYPVTAIVSLGFAGALTPKLAIGDVVVCATMHCASGFDAEERESGACAADANLLALASQLSRDMTAHSCVGSGVTVMQLDASPQRMKELRQTFRAEIVDMESYWIARMASVRQIPFIAVRSISDTMQQGVQPFDQILTSDGRLLWKRAVLCFLSHPHYLVNVFTLFKNTRHAGRTLTAFVTNLVLRI